MPNPNSMSLFTLVALLALPVCVQGQQGRDQYHQTPRDTVSQQVYDGWKQYELNCARCHGEYAVGTSFAPNLTVSAKDTGPINTKALFIETVCKGRPDRGMPAWCELGLETDKIEGIYSYVRARAIGAVGPGRPAVNPDLPAGVPRAKGDGKQEPQQGSRPSSPGRKKD
jgi:mono/diheme cytochrome c family protein